MSAMNGAIAGNGTTMEATTIRTTGVVTAGTIIGVTAGADIIGLAGTAGIIGISGEIRERGFGPFLFSADAVGNDAS